MRILAVANQKGGCGKTTVAVNLAAALAERGRRVLLVDMDPQAHATSAMGIEPSSLKHNLYDVLTTNAANRVSLDTVIQRLRANLYLAPAALFLSAVEQELAGRPGREERLLQALRGLNHSFHYVLLDCPPSLGLLTFNALRAAREVLVPVAACSFSLHGIDHLLESVEMLENSAGHRLRVGAVACNFNLRTRFAQDIYRQLQGRFGDRLLGAVVPPSIRINEASASGRTVLQLDRNNAASRSFQELAEEVCAQEANQEVQELVQAFERHRATHLLPSGEVQFYLADRNAQTVHVVGDFNNWTPTQEARMAPDGDGVFRTRLELGPGVYQYRFLVDGRWVEDPSNPRTSPAPFGGVNSILEVQDLQAEEYAHN